MLLSLLKVASFAEVVKVGVTQHGRFAVIRASELERADVFANRLQ
jgi:hypothetical protein